MEEKLWEPLTEEDKLKLRKVFCYLEDCLYFTQSMADLPTCNDCGKQDDCPYVPGCGERVRYNCPHWEAMKNNECVEN